MSSVRTIILRDTYRDSVYLMKLSMQARNETGAAQVSAMMGTARNKELFEKSGLLTPEAAAARPDDLVIALEADDAEAALACVRRLLDEAPRKAAPVGGKEPPATIEDALAEDTGLNMALISVAGDYARYEAVKAVSAGMDVMLYSDNISIDDELALKRLAASRGLMVMGPDCGTAIINGVPLAFANAVRRGPVGLIGASGTGLQEVSCLLDRSGVGVSQVFGTGGRDLKDAIGGLTTFAALDRLIADPLTKIIAVIGKPPGAATRRRLIDAYKKAGKPVFIHYLSARDCAGEEAAGLRVAATLADLARLIVREVNPDAADLSEETPAAPRLAPGLLRGLFGGGSLCREAAEIAGPILDGLKCSNLDVEGYTQISGSDGSRGHCFWDLGEDEFTVGRPHPMIAPDLKMERLVAELCDPAVSVVLTDMVIGFGSHPDQARLMVEALKKAERQSGGESRKKAVVVSVCGTDADTPSRRDEAAALRAAGVLVLGNNAEAARFAARLTKGN